MRPCAGVDHDGVDACELRVMNLLTDRTFFVGLIIIDLNAELFCQTFYAGVDVLQRRCAIMNDISLAEHVVIDSVQRQNLCHTVSIAELTTRFC
jgi:hypothetical protein